MKSLLYRARWIIRSSIALLVLGAFSHAAADGNYARFSNATVDCASGTAWADFDYEVEALSIIRGNLTIVVDSVVIYADSYENVMPEAASGSEATSSDVPLNGSVTLAIDVLNPDGSPASSTTFYAECPAEIADATFSQVAPGTPEIVSPAQADVSPGILPPDPEMRVMGTVVEDTPLYSVPGGQPAGQLMLHQDQTWFVVGSQIDDDGHLWYAVFVGGTSNAWVPATTVVLAGPLPQ